MHVQEFMKEELDAEALHRHFEPQIPLSELNELMYRHRIEITE